MQTFPSVPSLAITAFGIVCPATKLRFDVVGRAAPQGYTLAKPVARASVTVTFRATAPASPGTPARPPTCNSIVPSAATNPWPRPWPSTVEEPGSVRVSRMRAGTIGAYSGVAPGVVTVVVGEVVGGATVVGAVPPPGVPPPAAMVVVVVVGAAIVVVPPDVGGVVNDCVPPLIVIFVAVRNRARHIYVVLGEPRHTDEIQIWPKSSPDPLSVDICRFLNDPLRVGAERSRPRGRCERRRRSQTHRGR